MSRTTEQNISVLKHCGIVRSLMIAIILLCQSVMQAQTDALWLLQDSIKPWTSMTSLKSDNALGSNSIDLAFLKESIFGGRLEKSQIQVQADRMKSVNRIGGYSTSELGFMNFKDTLFNKPHWGLLASLQTTYLASAHFPKDLFSLIYQGNKDFDSLSIAPVRAQMQSYQKFSVGIFNKKNWNSVSIGLVVGQRMADLSLYSASFVTNTFGDTIQVAYNGLFERSDTSVTGMANGSGLGLATDINYHLQMPNQKGIISIALYDVGFVVWNKNTQSFRLNGTNTWTGIDTSPYVSQNLDSISLPNFEDSLKYVRKVGREIKPLPARIQFRYLHHLSGATYYEFGMQIMPSTAALPRIHFGLGQRVFENFLFTQTVSYGGFGRWGLGAGCYYMPKKSWYFAVQTFHLGGFTMDSSKSRNIQFSIAKIFKS
jgi:hypothetical protein